LDNVALLPVQLVNKDRQPVTQLKVAKMSEADVLSGSGSSATLDPDKDSDRFQVIVPGGAGLGTFSVKIATTTNPDTAYDDNATEVELTADANGGGYLATPTLLLVADDTDDDHQVDSVADDAKNDRTHMIQLEGKLVVTQIKPPGAASFTDIEISATVPVLRTVTCNLFVLEAYVSGANSGWSPATGPDNPWARPLNHFRVAQERWAQAGVKLELGAQSIVRPSQSIGERLGSLVLLSGGDVLADARAIIDAHGTSGTTQFDVFYVGLIIQASGLGFYQAALTDTDASYANTIFMSSNPPPLSIVLAHELGHLLTNRGHFGASASSDPNYSPSASDADKSLNLMAQFVQSDNFTGNRRLTQEQQNFSQ
jgi:hypothetical protein